MSLLDELTGFITDLSFDQVPQEIVNRAKLHVFDTLGAMFAGAGTEESRAARDLIEEMSPVTEGAGIPVPGFGFSAPLPSAVLLTCVATRMTETDDIDLSSCTTPGSVVVPTALCAAFQRGASGKGFFEGVLAGYEVITRLGAAANGPEILYRGIWPTYLCGTIGAATVVSRILGLSPEQTRHALAISLALSSGLAARIKRGLTSRWFTLGCAAQNGLSAAFAAERGFIGDTEALDTVFPSVYGLDIDKKTLLDGLGEKFRIEEVSLKPYCSARQAISPIEAFRWLLKTHQVDPESIEDVQVIVPRQYSQMIDREGFPDGRMTSIVGVRYQMALAAFYGEDLFDIRRKRLRDEERVRNFLKKVRVSASSEFSGVYPLKWPGKVVMKAAGKTSEHAVSAPSGAPEQPLSWKEVEEKIGRTTRGSLEPAQVVKLGAAVGSLDAEEDLGEFFNALPRGPF